MPMIRMLLLNDGCDYGGGNLKGVHPIKHIRAVTEKRAPRDDGAGHAEGDRGRSLKAHLTRLHRSLQRCHSERPTIEAVINSSRLRDASAETRLLAFSENITGQYLLDHLFMRRSGPKSYFRSAFLDQGPIVEIKRHFKLSAGDRSRLNRWSEQWPDRLSPH